MTESSLLRRIIFRVRPSLTRLEGSEQVYAVIAMVPVVLMTPIAVFGVVWLAAVTRWSALVDHVPLLVLLLVALIIIHARNHTIYFETRDGDLIRSIGSLDTVVVWSAMLIAGPVVLWSTLLEHVLQTVRAMIAARRRNQPPDGWARLSVLVQSMSALAFNLLSLAIYRALGGGYPLAGFALADWGPAVIGLAAGSVLSQALYYPLFRVVGTITGQAQMTLLSAFLLVMGLLMVPFAVLGALNYSEGAVGLFALYVAGIVLMNLLTYYLSRTNERSQQRARELTRLEALGEALIQAPPDLSTLESVLREHVMNMFPMDRFELRLFPVEGDDVPAGFTWPALHLTAPADRPPLPDADWERLRAANQSAITLPNVSPPDTTTIHGDALIVPIATDTPGEEGGERERLLGGIALLRHHDNGKTIHSLPALQALASQVASAYYRAHVHLETLAAQKMAQELELAGRIQARFLPDSVPHVGGWDIAAGLIPARQTSGDFYDFVLFDDGRLGVVVADVADKGTGAALYMALSRTLIRTFALQTPDSPETALCAANERLLTDTQSEQFVTVFYGVLNPANGTLTYANAGHNPGFVLCGDNRTPVAALPRTGLPLGMFEGMVWERATVTLAAGDALVLYTDGVSEAHDSRNAAFGETRLCDVVRTQIARPAADIRAAVTHAVQTFVGDTPQFDDITLMIAVRR